MAILSFNILKPFISGLITFQEYMFLFMTSNEFSVYIINLHSVKFPCHHTSGSKPCNILH